MSNLSNMNGTELFHYGVKGQKWGVRRSAAQLSRSMGGSSKVGLTKKEAKARASRSSAAKNRRTLSDKDLDQLVKRLETEKKLKTLVKEDLSPGKAATQKLLSNAGTKVVGTIVAGAGMYAVRGALTGDWSMKELASNIPKIKK